MLPTCKICAQWAINVTDSLAFVYCLHILQQADRVESELADVLRMAQDVDYLMMMRYTAAYQHY